MSFSTLTSPSGTTSSKKPPSKDIDPNQSSILQKTCAFLGYKTPICDKCQSGFHESSSCGSEESKASKDAKAASRAKDKDIKNAPFPFDFDHHLRPAKTQIERQRLSIQELDREAMEYEREQEKIRQHHEEAERRRERDRKVMAELTQLRLEADMKDALRGRIGEREEGHSDSSEDGSSTTIRQR